MAAAVRAKVVRVLFAEQIYYSSTTDLEQAANSDDASHSNINEEVCCSICIEPFQDEGDTVVSTTVCKHSFHRDCILGWSQIRDDCPNCRRVMWDKATFNVVEQEVAMILEEDTYFLS